MIRTDCLALAIAVSALGCSGTPIATSPDVVDTVIEAPMDRVKDAVTKVLTSDGYTVTWEDDHTLITGYRDKYFGPWNWLLHLRFGTLRNRVEARVTPTAENATRLRLQVLSEGKDGILTRWEVVQSPVAQSAENQLRLIKNTLQIL